MQLSPRNHPMKPSGAAPDTRETELSPTPNAHHPPTLPSTWLRRLLVVAGTQFPPAVWESKRPDSCRSHADSEPGTQSYRFLQRCKPSLLLVITAGCSAWLDLLLSLPFSLQP